MNKTQKFSGAAHEVLNFAFLGGDYTDKEHIIYDKEWNDAVLEWVDKNNVNKVEIMVAADMLKDMEVEVEELNELTSSNIVLSTYDQLYDLRHELKLEEGPGWEGYDRKELVYNNEYLYIGEDGGFYSMFKKIA